MCASSINILYESDWVKSKDPSVYPLAPTQQNFDGGWLVETG